MLAFGYNAGIVPGTKAAYGARLIVTQDGTVDTVFDRTDLVGEHNDKIGVVAWLQTEIKNYPTGWDPGGSESETITIFGKALAALKGGLKAGAIRTRESKGVVLYQDSTGAIVGNTNASAGYFYLAAYRYEDLPEGHPTLGLEMTLDELKGETA